MPVKHEADIETVLKVQLGLTTLVLTPVIYGLAAIFLPSSFDLARVNGVDIISFTPVKAWACVIAGLWSGCLIGFITEYYTSFSYSPVQEIANACRTGAATNIIYGLALGYKSTIIPVGILAGIIHIAHRRGFHRGNHRVNQRYNLRRVQFSDPPQRRDSVRREPTGPPLQPRE